MDMRNKVLPSFSSMHSEELRDWLKKRLNILGISENFEIPQSMLNILYLNQIISNYRSNRWVDNDSAQLKQRIMQNEKEQRQILLDNLINLNAQVYLLFIHTICRQHIYVLMHICIYMSALVRS